MQSVHDRFFNFVCWSHWHSSLIDWILLYLYVPLQLIYDYVETDEDHDEIDRNMSTVLRTMVLSHPTPCIHGMRFPSMCSTARQEFAPYEIGPIYWSYKRGHRSYFVCTCYLNQCCQFRLHALSGLMSQNSFTHFIRIDVVKFINTPCPDWCRKFHPHTLSRFMSRNHPFALSL